ncbi:hypothetical protein B0H19DRAFT_1061114 [Mycena capillaripes]|nr:hypothetical protein B0H19DRAFT_1061114 [Mycena capillaripes]
MFMGSWMIYCISFLLLAGRQFGPEPPFGLCIFQAALIHAVPSLGWSLLRSGSLLHLENFTVALELETCEADIDGLPDYTTVERERNHMFCHINTGLPTLVSAILSGWGIIIAVGVEIAAAIMLFRNSALLSPKTLPDPRVVRGMLIRISLFSLLTLLGLSFSAIKLFHVHESDIKWNILLPIRK